MIWESGQSLAESPTTTSPLQGYQEWAVRYAYFWQETKQITFCMSDDMGQLKAQQRVVFTHFPEDKNTSRGASGSGIRDFESRGW